MDEVGARQLKILLELTNPQDDTLFSVVMLSFITLGVVTEKELADDILVSLPSIRRWVRGRNLPHYHMRPAIHKYLRDKLEKVSRQ